VVKYQEKTKKPVVVLMDGLAASGGFWIAMPAEKIIATESTITGSIGVLMQTFVLTGLLKEWGVEAITYKTGELKDTGSFFREPTEKDKEEINSIMQATYRRFLDVILKHRAEKVGGEEKLRAVADGRILMAAVAKENGLVDEIGVLEDAIDSVKTLAGITGEVRVVRYQRQAGLAEILAPSAHANPLDRDTVLEWVTPRLLAMPAAFLPLAGATRE
jgi:protease-4